MPDWLPPMLVLPEDPLDRMDQLYKIFETDVKYSEIQFRGIPLDFDKLEEPGDALRYERGFWHLVGRKGGPNDRRFLDEFRAVRLPWFKALIVNHQDDEVLCWDYEEGDGNIRTYIWLEDLDYYAILVKRSTKKGDKYFIVSAHHIDGESKRRSLREKYKKRVP